MYAYRGSMYTHTLITLYINVAKREETWGELKRSFKCFTKWPVKAHDFKQKEWKCTPMAF